MVNCRHARIWTMAAIAALGIGAVLPAWTDAQQQRPKRPQRGPGGQRTKPTHADVAYGEHDQQKIDIYLAKSLFNFLPRMM